MRKPWAVNTSISRYSNNSLMLGILYTVLLLVAGELEFAAQVGLSPGPGSLAGQGGCQQEEPEEEHWAERAGARSAGTWGAGDRKSVV